MAKISVIIPVYNVEIYLSKCINSVRKQTHRNLEIILVNDGSTDRCGSICEEYAALDNRIKVIHQNNGGLADARNTGIDAATGEFLAFVDSDDWIDEDMYAVLYNLISKHEADVAMCRVREYSKKGIIDESTSDIVVCGPEDALELMVSRKKNYKLEHAVTNKLIKQELIQNFRFQTGKLMEDLYFTPPLIYKSEKCVYIDAAKYNYLTDRQESIMNSLVSEKKIFDELNGYMILDQFLSNKGIERGITHTRRVFLSRLLYQHYEVANSKLENKKEILVNLEELFLNNFKESKKIIKHSSRKLQFELFSFSPILHHLFFRLYKQFELLQKILKILMKDRLLKN